MLSTSQRTSDLTGRIFIVVSAGFVKFEAEKNQ